jgi:hypothetical protein
MFDPYPKSEFALIRVPRERRLHVATIVWAAALAFLATGCAAQNTEQAVVSASSTGGLHVQGNRLLNAKGQPVVLHGVNRSGAEYACVHGHGIFDGPADDASVQAITSWHTNAVRVPLNEDCWLGINGVSRAYAGANYQSQIANYVGLLQAHGLVAILDLHWNAPGAQLATGQQPMPDQDHAPLFWQQVATSYRNNSSVVFDLYNEPYPDGNRDTTAAWTCWRDGGSCPGVRFQAAGMQELVTTVRNTGAPNVILLGGVRYANALSQWLAYRPVDPTGNLVASWHVYDNNMCNTTSCFDFEVEPVAKQNPIVAGEIGEFDCAHDFIDSVMIWLDAHQQSYLAWSWDTTDCRKGPALITGYTGSATETFGQGYHDHLASLALTIVTQTPRAGETSPDARSSR